MIEDFSSRNLLFRSLVHKIHAIAGLLVILFTHSLHPRTPFIKPLMAVSLLSSLRTFERAFRWRLVDPPSAEP